MKKEILYPNILKCSLLCADNNWKKIFENLSYGVCPSGIYINRHYLLSTIDGKEFSYKIEMNKSIHELYYELSIVLKDFVHLKNNLNIGQGQTKWAQVKKKVIKDTLLERFVLDKSFHFNLSMNVTKRLLSFLIIGLMFKTISYKNIEYKDGFIHNIDGFRFENKKIIINKNIYQSKIKEDIVLEYQPLHKCLSESWNLYLQEFKIKN